MVCNLDFPTGISKFIITNCRPTNVQYLFGIEPIEGCIPLDHSRGPFLGGKERGGGGGHRSKFKMLLHGIKWIEYQSIYQTKLLNL